MQIEDMMRAVDRFSEILTREFAPLGFTTEFHSRGGLFREFFREEVPAPGASGKSGVYFITNPAGRVLYLGKSTTNNLGGEIYDKFRAATHGTPRFENSPLAKWATDPELGRLLVEGEVLMSAVAIEPGDLSSLVEVFLQSLCSRTEGLPPLNRRIG